MRYVFGDYTLDPERYELRRAGVLVKVQPKTFEVLAYLIALRERVVSRRELLEQLWPQQHIAETTLHSCIKAARQAVGDSGRAQRVIHTLHGRGYRFVAAVEVCDQERGDGARPLNPATPPALEQQSALVTAAPRPPSQLEAEYKPVTVLCCSLAEATALAARVGHEAMHRLMQAFFTTAQQGMQQYEGTITQFAADGFLALFGAPVAHEDHARRAVLAALWLQQRLRRLPEDSTWPSGEACAVRVGLHTGRILLDSLVEEQRLTYTAVGDTTQRAAELAQQAASGAILVSAATAQLVHGEVRLAACASVPLTGQTDPGPAYQVLGLGPRRAPLLPDGVRPRSRFVGRELELTTLQALLTRVAGGQGQVVGIVAEPGMGKTRLLAEFWQCLGDTPVTYLEGRCVSYGQATPYGPLQDLLRHACGCTEEDSPAVITAAVQQHLQTIGMAPAEAAPLLLHLLGVPDSAAPLGGRSSQEIRIQTFATLHQLLRHESHRQPLLVVVENLHWIDPTSQAYLVELVEWLVSVPLLLLVTFRPGYRPPWMEKSYATQLALPRLGPADSRHVVQAVLHPAPVPEPLMQGLLAKAGGNPLFLEELAWTVREHGDLQLPPEVPATIQAVLAARIDRLPPEAKQVLQTAAVIGTEVRLSLLQAMVGLSEEALRHGLQALQAAEFVYETRLVPVPTYMFKHALTQEVAYQSILHSTQAQYHRQIAQVIEERWPELAATQPELVAQHYTAAGLSAPAIPYWERAGRRATERSAHVEAIHHLTKGLELLARLPETPERLQQELSLQTALGPALIIAKGYVAPDVEETYARARALCQRLGETPQLFPVLYGLWVIHLVRATSLQAVRELAGQLLDIATHQDDPALLLEAHMTLGITLYHSGELVAAVVHLEAGQTLYDPHQHQAHASRYGLDPGVACLGYGALALWVLGSPDQAQARVHTVLHLAQHLTALFSLAFAHFLLALVHQHRHEVRATQEHAETLLALATAHHFPHWIAHGTMLSGWVRVMEGQPEAGLADIHQGLAILQTLGEDLARTHWLSLLVEACGSAGQHAAGLAAVEEALTLGDTNGEQFYRAELYRLKGELLLGRSREQRGEAEACFQQALAVARRQQAKSWELRAAMSLARLWQQQGKRTEAYALLTPLYGWFTEGFDTADLQEAKALLEDLEG